MARPGCNPGAYAPRMLACRQWAGERDYLPGNPAPTEHLSYDVTDFLQVEGDMVLACPADLETNSAALRYVLRECGKENVFSLRPKVG